LDWVRSYPSNQGRVPQGVLRFPTWWKLLFGEAIQRVLSCRTMLKSRRNPPKFLGDIRYLLKRASTPFVTVNGNLPRTRRRKPSFLTSILTSYRTAHSSAEVFGSSQSNCSSSTRASSIVVWSELRAHLVQDHCSVTGFHLISRCCRGLPFIGAVRLGHLSL
jgi:hypothetical protein